MPLTIDPSVLADPDQAARMEWLETNGIGGWAGASLSGALTRRYHGLLVTGDPADPTVRLSKLDETVVVEDARYELSSNRFKDGVYHPNGHEFLTSFSRDVFPEFEYQIGPIRIKKTIAAIQGQSTTVVVYEILETNTPFAMTWRPFVPSRPELTLTHSESDKPPRGEISFEGGAVHFQPSGRRSNLFINVPEADFDPSPVWYRDFDYIHEEARGLECREDLFSHGIFRANVAEGDTIGIVISDQNPIETNGLSLWRNERRRRHALTGSRESTSDSRRALVLAADQFILRKDDRTGIWAGYHWPGENLRDTLIALPGLLLSTNRFDEARDVLKSCSRLVNQGMIPDHSPLGDEEAQYNCIDTSLWLFVAAYRYLVASGDAPFVKNELLPVLKDIISWHEIGTRRGLRVDTDGLLAIAPSETPLTWMDECVNEEAVTPRHGKIVEVNALWYNALVITAELCLRFGDTYDAREYRSTSDRVKTAFQNVFWNKDTGGLYDTVDGNRRDATVRPNQLLALSLPVPVLISSRARRVLKTVENQLLTPRGLRTLPSDHEHYQGQYTGSPHDRHNAYHQGTSWGWLMGPYLTAVARIRPRTGRTQASRLLKGLFGNLAHSGIGTLSEIYDGEAPHTPRGCVAHAMAVGEMLRVMDELAIEQS